MAKDRETGGAYQAQQLRLILDSISDGVFALDADRRIMGANRAACGILGWSEEEFIGAVSHDLFHHHYPDGRPYPQEACPIFRTVQDGVQRYVDDEVFFRKDGGAVEVEYNCSPMLDGSGAVVGAVVTFADISARRRQERARSVETRVLERISIGAPLDEVLDAITTGIESITEGTIASIVLLDGDGRTIRHGSAPSLPAAYNDAVDGEPIGPEAGSCGTAMYRRERVVVIDIADDPLWAQYRELALAHGLRACWSTPVMSTGGAPLASFALYYREPRAPSEEDLELIDRTAHMVGIAIERQRKDQALRQSEERLKYLAAATVDTIWDWDLRTDDFWWSAGIQEQFGYEIEETRADPDFWQNNIHADDRERVVASVKAALDGDLDQWEGEYRFRHKDGNYIQVIDRGFVLRDDTGEPVRMVGGMTDQTEKLEMEERLQQAQRLESVGQLTGGIAHDFNNLLTVILGNAELMAEQAGDERIGSLAGMVSAAAERGAELTQRLLAFSRRQALAPKPVQLNRLAGSMHDMLQRTLGEHVELVFERDEGLWETLVDPVQMESALLNLCINARDAMPDGGRLTLRTENEYVEEDGSATAPGAYVKLTVADTGTGIPEAEQALIFEPFYTTKEPGKGTGLGLSMVYGFIKQSNGHIHVDSEPGRGTSIVVRLPRHVGKPGRAASRGTQEALAMGGNERILLVEDNELVRGFVERQLLDLGYVVATARDGEQALEILRERGDFDLLFTDIVMPGSIDGTELATRARALQKGLKALFTSGYADEVFSDEGRPGLLVKPYTRETLARCLREVLEGRR